MSYYLKNEKPRPPQTTAAEVDEAARQERLAAIRQKEAAAADAQHLLLEETAATFKGQMPALAFREGSGTNERYLVFFPGARQSYGSIIRRNMAMSSVARLATTEGIPQLPAIAMEKITLTPEIAQLGNLGCFKADAAFSRLIDTMQSSIIDFLRVIPVHSIDAPEVTKAINTYAKYRDAYKFPREITAPVIEESPVFYRASKQRPSRAAEPLPASSAPPELHPDMLQTLWEQKIQSPGSRAQLTRFDQINDGAIAYMMEGGHVQPCLVIRRRFDLKPQSAESTAEHVRDMLQTTLGLQDSQLLSIKVRRGAIGAGKDFFIIPIPEFSYTRDAVSGAPEAVASPRTTSELLPPPEAAQAIADAFRIPVLNTPETPVKENEIRLTNSTKAIRH